MSSPLLSRPEVVRSGGTQDVAARVHVGSGVRCGAVAAKADVEVPTVRATALRPISGASDLLVGPGELLMGGMVPRQDPAAGASWVAARLPGSLFDD